MVMPTVQGVGMENGETGGMRHAAGFIATVQFGKTAIMDFP